MRVLVTRPEPGAERTAARLAALGIDPVVLPLSQAVFEPGAFQAAIGRSWWAIALTSATAAAAVERCPEALENWRALPLFAVGRRTAERAASAGFSDIRIGGGNGAGLAEFVIDTAARHASGPDAEAPLLYCAGQPRAGDFEEKLFRAGLNRVAIDCYHMEARGYPNEVLHAVLGARPFSVALLYSRDSAERLFCLLAEAGLWETFRCDRILCLSERVAGGVPAHLRSITAVARQPTEEGLFELLGATGA